jgi:hypothetical protein
MFFASEAATASEPESPLPQTMSGRRGRSIEKRAPVQSAASHSADSTLFSVWPPNPT